MSRDPIEEEGGVNLYGFSGNNPLQYYDNLGLFIELWYGNHEVGAGQYHSKIWLITDQQSLVSSSPYPFIEAKSKTERMPDGQSCASACIWFVAMGAGPDGLIDELIADFNRVKDVDETLHNSNLVNSLSAEADAITFLEEVARRNQIMNSNFENTTLEYELFPGESYTSFDDWDEYNSNSYVSGLLGSFGYTSPLSGANTPGYQKSIPSFVFTKSFSSTKELKKEWKIHFPDF